MGNFGWSLPPGCGSLPGEEDVPCMVCGEFDTTCECPECPICGDIGNIDCYTKHGHMILSQKQIDTLAKNEKAWEDDAKATADYEADYIRNKDNYEW